MQTNPHLLTKQNSESNNARGGANSNAMLITNALITDCWFHSTCSTAQRSLNVGLLSLSSRYSATLQDQQVPDPEALQKWDDDEEGVSRSKVSVGHRRLHPATESGPDHGNPQPGGSQQSRCEYAHSHARTHTHTYAHVLVSCIVQDVPFILHARPPLFFLPLSFSLQRTKRTIVGYFEQKDSVNYHTYERVANILRDDCVFLAAFE